MQAPNSGPVPFLTPAQKSPGLSSANASFSTPGLQVTGLGSTSPEPEPEAPNRPQKRKRILLVSACLGITAVIAIAIALGVHFGTRRNNNNASTSNLDTSTDGPVQQDPNNPSIFTKDPKLKNSFYGVVYNMRDVLYATGSLDLICTQTLADTIVDVQLLSQITTRIRLNSAECNQTALVLEAIKQTKTNLKVFPAIYIYQNEMGYQGQKTALQQALQTYGRDNILGIIVGVRFMYNYISQQNGTSADSTGTIGLAASAALKEKIADIRQVLKSMGIDILVGTAEAYLYFNNDLLGAVDFGMSYLPSTLSMGSQDAAMWVPTTFKETNVDVANALANKPQMYIGATGWPTFSQTASERTNASESSLQIYINNFVCTANTQRVRYFWFDFNDNPWTAQRYDYGVEGFWGLFNTNKTLKAITLPDCSHD